MIYEKLFKLSVGAVVFCFCLSSPAPAGTAHYTYDNLNRLTQVQFDDGAVIQYTYDAAGNRLTKQVTAFTPPSPSPPGGAPTVTKPAPRASQIPADTPAPAAVAASPPAVTVAPLTAGPSREVIASGYLEWPGLLRRIREARTAGELELLQQDLKDGLEESGLGQEEKTRYQELAAQELEARTDYLRGESATAGEAAGKESPGAPRKREAAGERPHRRIQVDKGKIFTAEPEAEAEKSRP